LSKKSDFKGGFINTLHKDAGAQRTYISLDATYLFVDSYICSYLYA